MGKVPPVDSTRERLGDPRIQHRALEYSIPRRETDPVALTDGGPRRGYEIRDKQEVSGSIPLRPTRQKEWVTTELANRPDLQPS